ncbi:MAG: hypothetical protein IKN79_03125 [Eubacterium sp.]|nr:hypothetical protein [Eubacterium sp.]
METVGSIKETRENTHVRLIAIKPGRKEVFWEGLLKEIPVAYERIDVCKENWLLGSGLFQMFCPYEDVAGVQNGVEAFRRRIRQAVIFSGMEQEMMTMIPVREEDGNEEGDKATGH